MIEFEKPNIKCLEIDKDGNYAKVVCEPLERGYGITIGNSLRRILLSSLPGSAITSVKIDGVLHEFSTVKDVVEDAVDKDDYADDIYYLLEVINIEEEINRHAYQTMQLELDLVYRFVS